MQRYRIANIKSDRFKIAPTLAQVWSGIQPVTVFWVSMAFWGMPSEAVAQTSCPIEVESLVEQMLPDLPGYANRAIARSRQRENPDPSSSIVIAGQPEFTPLPLGTERSIVSTENSEENIQNIQQVFLTTLDRVYTAADAIELQGYHWLFLTATENGWQLAVMYSAFDSYPAGDAPTPPENTTDGAIAQGVRNWLRDCQAREMELQSRV
ncbi:hypothetical protein IQ235_09560 [Oscillatoriales cyanobacterium LEGE 11467]|uniref:Uncharacterized protein n=1 Tax=Zarconia navalis LEGE 11467 TaxID=1828826 RepID=A0A928VZ82_9CYAN|nr:hypothetical protein [Zarconia navalis]MBE9041026.1 hypothetical protein [Zarconia navalis LEGE 11467]